MGRDMSKLQKRAPDERKATVAGCVRGLLARRRASTVQAGTRSPMTGRRCAGTFIERASSGAQRYHARRRRASGRCASEAVDVVGSTFFRVERHSLQDLNPWGGEVPFSEGLLACPFGFPEWVVDLTTESRRLAVLVEGDALDGGGVRLKREEAVESRPEALA